MAGTQNAKQTTGNLLRELSPEASGIVLERYKYILQQQHTLNEAANKILALYQTILTAIVAAVLTLFVNYPTWKIPVDLVRTGVHGLLGLATTVAAFTILMISVGILSWLDYRREECSIADQYMMPGFRKSPNPRNFYRWYETWIMAFVVLVTILLWVLIEAFLIPRIV